MVFMPLEYACAADQNRTNYYPYGFNQDAIQSWFSLKRPISIALFSTKKTRLKKDERVSRFNAAQSVCYDYREKNGEKSLKCNVFVAPNIEVLNAMDEHGVLTFFKKSKDEISAIGGVNLFRLFILSHEVAHALNTTEMIEGYEQYNYMVHQRPQVFQKELARFEESFLGEAMADLLAWYNINQSGIPLKLESVIAYRRVDSMDCFQDEGFVSHVCDAHQTSWLLDHFVDKQEVALAQTPRVFYKEMHDVAPEIFYQYVKSCFTMNHTGELYPEIIKNYKNLADYYPRWSKQYGTDATNATILKFILMQEQGNINGISTKVKEVWKMKRNNKMSMLGALYYLKKMNASR